MAWCRLDDKPLSEPMLVCLLMHICSEFRDHFAYANSQWETTLQCDVVSQGLGALTKWSLLIHINAVLVLQILCKRGGARALFRKDYCSLNSMPCYSLKSNNDRRPHALAEDYIKGNLTLEFSRVTYVEFLYGGYCLQLTPQDRVMRVYVSEIDHHWFW